MTNKQFLEEYYRNHNVKFYTFSEFYKDKKFKDIEELTSYMLDNYIVETLPNEINLYDKIDRKLQIIIKYKKNIKTLNMLAILVS